MIDVKKPLRKSYYELLNGNLSFNSTNVPVSDDVKKFGATETKYVIISSQSGTNDSTFSSFDSQEDIVLDIVFKAKGRANKDAVDSIANQILGLVLPAPAHNGLPPQSGVDFHCVELSRDGYLGFDLNESSSVVRRLLTFTQKVRQTTNTVIPAPVPAIPGFKSPITSADFDTATEYNNVVLLGRNYDIFLNDSSVFLEENVEWEKIITGGIRILLTDFDATTDDVTIYILLK